MMVKDVRQGSSMISDLPNSPNTGDERIPNKIPDQNKMIQNKS